MITTAADLHRHLTRLSDLDFHPEHHRDLQLYIEINHRLALPDEKFLKALESRKVSAACYLRTPIAGLTEKKGEVIDINYDDADLIEPGWTTAKFISSARPGGNGVAGLRNALRSSYVCSLCEQHGIAMYR